MIRYAVTAALLGLSHPASASAFEDLAAIDRQVAAFTGADIGVSGGARAPVDRKLRLRACGAALDLSWHGARQDAVLVRCPVADGWRIFVPVLRRQAEAPRVLVDRRDRVKVAAGGRGFSVSRMGEALESGGAGDWIRVRLDDDTRRGTVVSAEIMPDGDVRVPVG